ncbi:MAG: hypothetical protein AAF989_02470 [Planctomycetota bacterium]
MKACTVTNRVSDQDRRGTVISMRRDQRVTRRKDVCRAEEERASNVHSKLEMPDAGEHVEWNEEKRPQRNGPMNDRTIHPSLVNASIPRQ